VNLESASTKNKQKSVQRFSLRITGHDLILQNPAPTRKLKQQHFNRLASDAPDKNAMQVNIHVKNQHFNKNHLLFTKK
jgi:hypothetical protein